MTSQLKLGAKVRALRRREGLTQTDLAAKLEISPSYLNLIEHNQRPLPAHLLLRVAQVLKADLGNFADDNSARLAADLQEAFGDPLFQEHPLTTNDVRELAENATAARAVLSLYQAYRSSIDSTRDAARNSSAASSGVILPVSARSAATVGVTASIWKSSGRSQKPRNSAAKRAESRIDSA